MPLKKIKKRKKVSRMRGSGTHGGGARKKRKKSGHHGGAGMAGTGKRADHKKTLITALYGHGYFGKQGITSKKTEKDRRKRISIEHIELNLEKFGKKTDKGWEINLPEYKILDGKKDYEIKNKLIIKAKEASSSVIEKIKKVGGEISLLEKNKKNSLKENNIENKRELVEV